MDIPSNPEIQAAIDSQLATGKYASAEEVVLTALRHLADEDAEYASAVKEMRESIDDENAGRTKPLAEVVANIRERYGFRESLVAKSCLPPKLKPN